MRLNCRSNANCILTGRCKHEAALSCEMHFRGVMRLYAFCIVDGKLWFWLKRMMDLNENFDGTVG